MRWDDPFNCTANANHILNGTEPPDLAAAWMEFPQITDRILPDIVKLFRTDYGTFIKGVIQCDDYTTEPQFKENVSSVLKNLMFLFVKPKIIYHIIKK